MSYNLEKILDAIRIEGKSIIPGFDYDIDLLRVYTILAMYFFQDPRFEEISTNYSLRKGLLIRGNPGVGKAICLKVLEKFLRKIKHPDRFTFHPTTDIIQEFRIEGEKALLKHGMNSFKKNPTTGIFEFNQPLIRCYDDLGLESKQIKYYGTERNIMSEILFKRNDLFISKGMKTIVTTNYLPEEFSKYYDYRIRGRMREMFNDIIFEGPDRRS